MSALWDKHITWQGLLIEHVMPWWVMLSAERGMVAGYIIGHGRIRYGRILHWRTLYRRILYRVGKWMLRRASEEEGGGLIVVVWIHLFQFASDMNICCLHAPTTDNGAMLSYILYVRRSAGGKSILIQSPP